MDAVILAAGKGTRLKPHTDAVPKPLLPVKGRPILDWIIGALPPVDKLVVVVNHLAEQVEAYLAAQPHVRNWATARQAVPRGTGDAVLSCRDAISPDADRVLVVNGDDLYAAADLARLAACPAGILTRAVDTPELYGIVTRHPDGTLARLDEKPDIPGPALANIGAYVFPRAVFDLTLPLSVRGEYEITDAVTLLAAAGRFDVVEATYWLPIGNVAQWTAAQTADTGPCESWSAVSS